MNNNSTKRIQNELKEEPACKLRIVGCAQKILTGEMSGPVGTPYEGGTYRMYFEIPNDYPKSPPIVKFTTKIWHPNVDSETGAVCLKQFTWKRFKSGSPIVTLRTVMRCLRDLISAPEPDDPVDAFVASQYKENRQVFEKTAQYWAQKYAGAACYDDLVKKIVQLGYREELAINSLSKSNFDLQAAIDELSS